jgi:DNA-binding transcriptional LysR family regulator
LRYDLNDLQLFVHIAEAGSITGGAARAHLALASASERVRGMEQALGVALLARGRRGAQPTPAGLVLLRHARLIAQQVERMRAELGQYGRGLKGQVRLLSNTSALTEFLPQALSTYMAGHPQVDVEVEERTSVESVAAIRAGSADLGIIADSADAGTLQTVPFRTDRLVLVCAREHPLAARRAVGYAQALAHDFIGLSKGSALQDHLAAQAARAGLRLKTRVRLHSFNAVCGMVERNIGVAVIPETAALRCQKTMAIKRVRLTDAWATRQLRLCMRNLEQLPPYARELVEHLQS